MSDLSFIVGKTYDLALVPPAGFVLPSGPEAWSIDNPALATLDASGTPVKITGLQAGTVTVTCTDGQITATLAMTFGLPVATTASIVATLDPASA